MQGYDPIEHARKSAEQGAALTPSQTHDVLARVAELEVELVNVGAKRAMVVGEMGSELRRVQAALRALLDAVESPRRAIYVDEVVAARRALHMEPVSRMH